MSTIVFFHAHPDDESLSTGGTIARASAEGHRVVLVVATNGDHGQVPADLAPGETLVDRRRKETEKSCQVLGVHRLAWLGYADSGMTGWPQNQLPGAFMSADLEAAANKLAQILTEEHTDVFVTYDWHGNYGHPDHIMVHKVGHRAAEIANITTIFETTANRDHFRRMKEMAKANQDQLPEGVSADDFDPDGPADDGNPFGEPEANISHKVDVLDYCEAKRNAIGCHASQVTDSQWFLSMPPDVFKAAFGAEWFIRKGQSGPPKLGFLTDELTPS